MKRTLILVLLALSGMLFAKPSPFPEYELVFDCTTVNEITRGKQHRIQFTILTNMRRASLVTDENDIPFKVTPENSKLSILNDNYSLVMSGDRLSANGDGDGIEFVDLVLYRNTYFKSGYVRVRSDAGYKLESIYSEISCKVKRI